MIRFEYTPQGSVIVWEQPGKVWWAFKAVSVEVSQPAMLPQQVSMKRKMLIDCRDPHLHTDGGTCSIVLVAHYSCKETSKRVV